MDPNNPNPTPATPPANPAPPANQAPAQPPAAPPANEPPATPPANPPADGGNPPATPPAEPPPTTPPAENTPPAQPDELDQDILDLAKTGEEQEAAKAEADKAAEAEYLKAAGFESGIQGISFGKGEDGAEMTMEAADVGALVAAMRHTGVPADKAKAMLATVGALDRIRADRQAEADRQTLRNIREDARKEFGDGLVAAARDMQAGGLALFGADLWADICTVPALTNDKRFIRALAAYGSSRRNDTGGPVPGPGGDAPGGPLRFDLQSWMKGNKG